MPSHTPNQNRAPGRRSGLPRRLAGSQSGFTIIEVVVAAVIISALAGGTATALIATSRVSGDQRLRSQADAVAQADQERLRGMSIRDLSRLNEIDRPVGPYNGTTYKVTSTGQYLSTTGTDACATSGTGAAAYVRIKSSVTWDGNRRTPVVQESVITPQIGGTLLTNVKDQLDNPVSGAAVNAAGADFDSGTTESQGCTIFNSMATGDYYHWVTMPGHVDPNGNVQTTRGVSVGGSGTTVAPVFRFGQAGGISAFFKTTIGGTTLTGQKAPALSWFNPGMNTSRNNVVAPTGSPAKTIPAAQINSWTSTFNLYPFTTGPGTYTGNYTVWAGSCDAANPPTSQSTATVGPGGWAILDDGGSPVKPRVLMPALILNVKYKPDSSTTPFAVVPAAVSIKDSCGQTWWPEVRTPANATHAQGQLRFPGQPYAPVAEPLEICADYTPNGGANYYRTNAIFKPNTPNDNFTTGTTKEVTLDATNGWAQGRCPS